jgi:hypothetical protein
MSDNIIDLNSFRNKEGGKEISKNDMIIDIAIAITHDIVDKLYEAGYSFEAQPAVAYDLIMLTEAIKSLIHTAEGEYYPLHQIASGLFDSEEAGDFLDEFLE